MQVVATGFGSPEDVLKIVQTEGRAPKEGEVAIVVRAASVNHADYKSYADRNYATRGGKTPQFSLPLGFEAAGTVTAVGPKADGPAGPIIVGDEVIAYRISGAYADAVVVEAANVIPKPSRLSWEQAAAMMLTGTTAVHAFAAVCARRGQTVLIHAATGGVGLAALQMAQLQGINIVGTAGERGFEAVRRYGATPVAYGEGLLDRVRNTAPQGIDAALDFIGTDEAIDVSLELVKDRSRIATIVAFDRAKRDNFISLGGSAGSADEGRAIRNEARLPLAALAQAQHFDVVVSHTFPLTEAAKAHQLIAKGGGGGHIVLVPA